MSDIYSKVGAITLQKRRNEIPCTLRPYSKARAINGLVDRRTHGTS